MPKGPASQGPNSGQGSHPFAPDRGKVDSMTKSKTLRTVVPWGVLASVALLASAPSASAQTVTTIVAPIGVNISMDAPEYVHAGYHFHVVTTVELQAFGVTVVRIEPTVPPTGSACSL